MTIMSTKSIYELLSEAKKKEVPFIDDKKKPGKADKADKNLPVEEPKKEKAPKKDKPVAKPKIGASGLTKEVSKEGLTHLNSIINKLGFDGKLAEITIDDLLVLKAHIIAVLESSGISVDQVTSLVTQMAQMISTTSKSLSDSKAKEIVDTSFNEIGNDGSEGGEEDPAGADAGTTADIVDSEKFNKWLGENSLGDPGAADSENFSSAVASFVGKPGVEEVGDDGDYKTITITAEGEEEPFATFTYKAGETGSEGEEVDLDKEIADDQTKQGDEGLDFDNLPSAEDDSTGLPTGDGLEGTPAEDDKKLKTESMFFSRMDELLD